MESKPELLLSFDRTPKVKGQILLASLSGLVALNVGPLLCMAMLGRAGSERRLSSMCPVRSVELLVAPVAERGKGETRTEDVERATTLARAGLDCKLSSDAAFSVFLDGRASRPLQSIRCPKSSGKGKTPRCLEEEVVHSATCGTPTKQLASPWRQKAG